MSFARRISEHRAEVLLIVLAGVSLVSLATDTRASLLRDAVRKTVTLTSYPFIRVMKQAEVGTDYVLNLVFNYDRLHAENQGYRQELATMKVALARLGELREENIRLRALLDYERGEPRLSLAPARVIETYRGTLTIDLGSRHGVEPFMGVITDQGVVGVITEADLFTSVVATLHHPDCRVGAMVRRSRVRAYDGIVHAGENSLDQICTMEYVDLKEDVRVGEEVVTSPESVFPTGYPIGRITAWHDSGSLWKTADIYPAVDMYRLDEVFVVMRAAPSSEELAGMVQASAAANAAAPMPDDRPLQERYAP